MAKKLFEVEIQAHAYIMAENSTQAESEVRCKISRHDMDFNAYEARGNHCYHDWQNERPYNSDDDKTVGEIIEELKKKQEKKEYIKKHYREISFK